MSGFSSWINCDHSTRHSLSLSTQITSVFGISSHVPTTIHVLRYGSFSPYVKNVVPMNVTSSPFSSGKTKVSIEFSAFILISLLYSVFSNTSPIVNLVFIFLFLSLSLIS